MINSKLEFEDPYELIEYLTKMIRRAQAYEDTSSRISEALEYAQNYCMPDALGKNIWHAILDDAIKMRKELATISNRKL